jgi:SNF1-activating kinase 1
MKFERPNFPLVSYNTDTMEPQQESQPAAQPQLPSQEPAQPEQADNSPNSRNSQDIPRDQAQPQSLATPLGSASQTPLIRTANTTPIPSPGLYSTTQNRSNMALPPAPQAASEGTTPLGISNSPYLHPLQGRKVRE